MDIKLYIRQIEFTKSKLGKEKDKSDSFTIDHCIRVFYCVLTLLHKHKVNVNDIRKISLAALFHDLLEDTKTTEKEILKQSDKETLDIVKEMTVDFNGKEIKDVVKPLFSTSDEFTIVKLADIYDNVRKSNFFFRNNGIVWYHEFFFPLLNEYKKLIRYKIIHSKKYKKIIKKFSSQVLEEISNLEESTKIYNQLLHE